MMPKYYNYQQIDSLIGLCTYDGYECVQLREGVLGSGDWALISPDDKHWNFEVREIGLSDRSSAHTIKRSRKISKRLQKEIEEAMKNGN